MMADNDKNNDEYEFSELDSFDEHSMDEDSSSKPSTSKPASLSDGRDVKRNAFIAVMVIILAMVIYKLVGWFHVGKNNHNKSDQALITPAQPISPPIPRSIPQSVRQIPVLPAAPPVVKMVADSSNAELKERLSTVETSQEAFRTEVTSLTEQIRTVNNNINDLNTQMATLKQLIADLSNQVNKQAEGIRLLSIRLQPKPVRRVLHRMIMQPVVYYIQAVIPGRAWLIGSNGSTLTVREGTEIAGYGMVRLIDSLQGRVLTSSGRVIKFSQEDS